MNFLSDLLDLTDDAETPKPFIYWTGLSCIAAVTRRNVYFDKFYYKVFPNIYVMLIGKSGTRKSFATNLGKKLVLAVGNTRIISGMNSIESMLKSLSFARTSENGGPPDVQACALLSSNEFSNLIIEYPQALTIITELYDTGYNTGEWKKNLVSGEFILKDPCITFISASNQTHFKDRIRTNDIKGGFIARTHLIVCDKKHKVNALVRKPERLFDPSELVPELKRISMIKGEFKFEDNNVMQHYEEWYADFCASTKEDDTGTVERIQDHILKIAMLLSLSEKNELIFTQKNIEEAISACYNMMSNVKSITVGIGISEMSGKLHKFCTTLIEAEGNILAHDRMLSKNFMDFDVHDLGRIVESLIAAKFITVVNVGNKIYYKLTDKFLEEYQGLKKEVEN